MFYIIQVDFLKFSDRCTYWFTGIVRRSKTGLLNVMRIWPHARKVKGLGFQGDGGSRKRIPNGYVGPYGFRVQKL